MIYSNFTTRSYKGQIVLGTDSRLSNTKKITCVPPKIHIEIGANSHLIMKEHCFLKEWIIEQRKSDYHDTTDPNWNIPKTIFLCLTSNYIVRHKNYAKQQQKKAIGHFKIPKYLLENGLVQIASAKGSNGSKGRENIWSEAIFKTTSETAIIVIKHVNPQIPQMAIVVDQNHIREYTFSTLPFQYKTFFETENPDTWINIY